MAKILSIIAPAAYQDIEYGNSKEALEAAGHEVITCSTIPEAHGCFGGRQQAEVLLKDAKADDYDAVLFVGGGGCEVYFDDHAAHDLACQFKNQGKPVTAICAAPSILANAGLLEGVRSTCFPSQADNLKNKGAHFTGNPVEADGLFVTANGPEAATAFGEKIAEILSK